MTIYIDADACPKMIKNIVFKAIIRTGHNVVLVANQALTVPKHPLIKTIRVAQGFDVADETIIEHVKANDLVITADIPLADQVIAKGAQVLTPRGEHYTDNNIKSTLSMRNFMTELRASGAVVGGPAPLHQRDRQRFANVLDRYLVQSKGLGC